MTESAVTRLRVKFMSEHRLNRILLYFELQQLSIVILIEILTPILVNHTY